MTENAGKQRKNWNELPPEKIASLMNRKSEGYFNGYLGLYLGIRVERARPGPHGYREASSGTQRLSPRSIRSSASRLDLRFRSQYAPPGRCRRVHYDGTEDQFSRHCPQRFYPMRRDTCPHRPSDSGLGRTCLGWCIRQGHCFIPMHANDHLQKGIRKGSPRAIRKDRDDPFLVLLPAGHRRLQIRWRIWPAVCRSKTVRSIEWRTSRD